MKKHRPSFLLSAALAATSLCGGSLLTGCAVGNLVATNGSLPSGTSGLAISGAVHGGQQPVSGSTVQLWETGTSGYGAGSAQLLSTVTTAVGTGAFSFPTANVSANCTGGPFTYITATGGDPTGQTLTNVNTSIKLVAIIGGCSTTGASTTVTINEVTTAAAAYALSGFVKDTAGTISVGAPSTNAQGLADAIANAGLLASSTTGAANSSTTSVALPTVMLNSLADALAACINIGTTSNSNTNSCTSLYGYTTPPGTTTVPTDTFQAAVNMAKYPGSNVSNILNLASATAAPFVPSVSTTSVTTGSATVVGTAPNDLTLGIVYLNPSITQAYESASTLAIDKNDNVFVIGASGVSTDSPHYGAGTTQWLGEVTASSTGGSTPYTATSSTTLLGEPETAIIDNSNNIWIGQNYEPSATQATIIEIPNENMANAKNITLYDPSGSSLYVAENSWAIAIDGSSNIWTSSYRGAGSCAAATSTTANTICEYQELTAAQQSASTPTFTDAFGSGSTRAVTSTTRGMFADANVTTTTYNGSVWSTNYNAGGTLQLLIPGSSTTPASLLSYTASTASNTLFGIALDSSSNAWITSYATAGLWTIPAGSPTGTAATAATAASPTSVASAAALPSSTATQGKAGGLKTPKYLAIDGVGNIFIANYGYGGIVEYSPSYNSGAGAYLSPYLGFSPSLTIPAQTLQVTAYSINGSNVVTVYANNNLPVGSQVTLSGFPTSTFLNGVTLTVASEFGLDFTASSSTFTHATVAKMTESGVAAIPASNQAVVTCPAAATSTCTIGNAAIGFNNNVVIDKAGSVWSLSGNGAVLQVIGLAAPTDPILSDGKYGVQP
jgi:hypothetical protein